MVGPKVVAHTIEPDVLEVEGLTAEQISEAAAVHGVVLHELTPIQASLEEAFMELTRVDVEYKAAEASSAQDGIAA